MIARGLKYLAAALLLVVVIVTAAGFWVLHTESGSAWAWQRLRAAVPGELTAASFEGTFTGGLRLRALSWANPSLEVTAARVRLAIDPGFFPPALSIEALDAGNVVVRQRARPKPEEPAQAFSPESLALPLEIRVRALDLERLRVLNPRGETLFAVRRAELAGRWHEVIVLSRLAVDTSMGAVRGSVALSLHEPFEASGSLNARYPFESGGDVVPVAFAADFAGSLSDLRVRLDGEMPDLVVEGRLFDLLDAPEWELEARSPRLQWPLRGPEPTVTLTDLVVASRGSDSDYTLSGRGGVIALVDEPSQFSLDATGDAGGLDVSRLRVDGALLTARSEGALEWRGGFGFRVDADVARFDPAALTPRWPAGMPVRGRAIAAFRPGKLRLESAHAELADTGRAADAQLDARGLIDLEARVVDLSLDWRNLRWPVAGDSWRLRSDSGDVAVTGRPDDWTLAGRIALQTPGLPPGTFELAGSGSREEATVTIEDSRVLGGTVAGRVHYARPEGGHWIADLSAAGLETGALAAAWPGRISADFAAEGRIEPLELAIDIEQLSGTLRGRPLEGSGGFRWARGNLAVQDLRLASGEARLTADGSLRAEPGLDFALEVPSLGALVRRAAGRLHAEGTVSLGGDFPRAEFVLDGRELAWRDWRLGRLEVTATEGAEPLMLEIDGRALALGAVRTGRFSTDLAASDTRQRLEAAATLDGRQVELILDGRLGDWRRPLESGWTGRLQSLALADDLQYRLESPADLTLAPDRVALERACLQGEAAGRVCVAGAHAGAGDYRISADLENLPANLARLLVRTELEFTQTLDGSLSVRGVPGRQMSADARIDIAAGRVHNPENPRMALATRAGSFRLDLDEGQVLLARLNLPVGESAALDAEFALADVRRGENSGISGSLAVNVYDIGVFAALVPTISRAGGHLQADLALDGTVARPVLQGEASLTNGRLRYAPLGLELEDIDLRSRIAEGNRIELQSTFTAGEGTGRLYSSANGLGGAADEVRLRLTGDNLTVVDLPQVNVVADMDVGVGVTPQRLTLNGDVRIPKARLSPREIAATRVSESDDVVIVASRREEEEEEEAGNPPPFAIEGRVDLTLGDDVTLDFEAAETRLSGAVSFAWNGPPMPVASGEYRVGGRFEVYGQLLEITEGSIRFSEVPATNPQLRIRAEREIFGNPQIRTAGVLVSGTAQDPEVEVYTNPPTTRERALTLLVTGSDFDYEQGVGAVDVGTYIAPDLYLSYGIGLFDRENVISVRYDFARGFGIKATSGKSTEGVDLSYTFER